MVLNRRVILICIDGLDPNLLYSMIHEKELPAFKKIVDEGVHGYTISLLPPLSPAVWISLATGLTPLEHGVFDFIQAHLFRDSVRVIINSSKALQGTAIWDYISMAGMRSILVNYPFTYPSYPIKGIMVAGFPSPSDKPDITPKLSIPKDVFVKYRTEYIPTLNYVSNLNEALSLVGEASERMVTKTRLFSYLVKAVKNWSFAVLALTEVDRVQHMIFGKYKNALKKLYEILDKIIERIIVFAKQTNANMIIVSDHGFEPLKSFVHITNLGLLKKYTYNPFSSVYVIRSKTLQRLLLHSPIPNYMRHLVKEFLVRHKENFVNKPIIITSNYTLKVLTKDIVPYIKNYLINYEEQGEKIFDVIFSLEDYNKYLETIHGISLNKYKLISLTNKSDLPDIILAPKTGYELTFNPSKNISIRSSKRKSGTHYSIKATLGLFMAWGPNVVSTPRIVKVSVFDIAPSILGLLGIAGRLKGTARKDIFEIDIVHEKEAARRDMYLKLQSLKRKLKERGI